MYSQTILKEFEWHLRDLFFRSNKNNNQDFIKYFRKDEVVNDIINNYLRFRNSDPDEILNLLNRVLENMQKINVLMIVDSETIKISSNFNRKQCTKCFYINYLSINEHIQCSRCNSDNLQEFPKRKNK